MRTALVLVLTIVLCFAGYGVAFQVPSPVREERTSPLARTPGPSRGPTPALAAAVRHVAPGPETYAGFVDSPATLQSQQLAAIISKSGLRFLSPKAGLDIDEVELPPEGLFVLCDSADVTTDSTGQPEVVCRGAAVIRTAGMNGKAGELRYKAGCLVLESEDADSLIARQKGDKMVFLLRAKTIQVNLNTQQIEGSDGSVIQWKPDAKPKLPEPAAPESSLPQ